MINQQHASLISRLNGLPTETPGMPRVLTLQEKHPELFVRDSYVDPRSRKREIPMEVLCFGYMRTGTACESTKDCT